MFHHNLIFILFIFPSIFCSPHYHVDISYLENNETDIFIQLLDTDLHKKSDEINSNDGYDVIVRLYYESLCPDCIQFDKNQFSQAVQKLNQYVDFQTYPYGNANTIKDNGKITFRCQHGPPECYGNKLHACAIDYLQNYTEALLFNSCMMGGENRGSNDAAADRCARLQGLDSKLIKECAKGDRGTKLLEYYGEESKEANFTYVPYILINEKENDGDNFFKDICSAFAIPPPPCVEYYSISS